MGRHKEECDPAIADNGEAREHIKAHILRSGFRQGNGYGWEQEVSGMYEGDDRDAGTINRISRRPTAVGGFYAKRA